MGFGTLFAGYFLILNFAYYGFSDFIAAAIMLYALYKLSSVNQSFKLSMYAMCAFTVFALGEFVIFVLDMFSLAGDMSLLNAYMAMVRNLLICVFTVLMLLGMRDVCYEVDLRPLGKRFHNSVIAVFIVYALNILLEAQGIFPFIGMKIMATAAGLTIIATLILVVINLVGIYTCYMKICMPDEEQRKQKKKHRTPKFVEAFRRHEEEKSREYIEYKLKRRAERAEKNKNNGKKD